MWVGGGGGGKGVTFLGPLEFSQVGNGTQAGRFHFQLTVFCVERDKLCFCYPLTATQVSVTSFNGL